MHFCTVVEKGIVNANRDYFQIYLSMICLIINFIEIIPTYVLYINVFLTIRFLTMSVFSVIFFGFLLQKLMQFPRNDFDYSESKDGN